MLLFIPVSTSAYNVEQTVVMTLLTWPNHECLVFENCLFQFVGKKVKKICKCVPACNVYSFCNVGQEHTIREMRFFNSERISF